MFFKLSDSFLTFVQFIDESIKGHSMKKGISVSVFDTYQFILILPLNLHPYACNAHLWLHFVYLFYFRDFSILIIVVLNSQPDNSIISAISESGFDVCSVSLRQVYFFFFFCYLIVLKFFFC